MLNAPYRWLPRTIIPNLKSILYDIYYGVGNIIRYVPVIWFDRDYDWGFLAHIMEYKLRRMHKLFITSGHLAHNERYAKQMFICAILLKRLQDDNYWKDGKLNQWDYRAKCDQELLFKIMGKHFCCWWD